MKTLGHELCCQSRKRAFPASLLLTGHMISQSGTWGEGASQPKCVPRKAAWQLPTMGALPALPLPCNLGSDSLVLWTAGLCPWPELFDQLPSKMGKSPAITDSLTLLPHPRVPKQPVNAIARSGPHLPGAQVPFSTQQKTQKYQSMQKYARNVPGKVSMSSWSTGWRFGRLLVFVTDICQCLAESSYYGV